MIDRQVLIWSFGGKKPEEKLNITFAADLVHIHHSHRDGSGKVYEEDLYLSPEAAKSLGDELHGLQVEVVNG